MVYTRKGYMAEHSKVFADNPHVTTPFHELLPLTNALHRKYYAQFVNQSTINAVVRQIGKANLLASTDEYLNDIPLKLWDNCQCIMAMRMEEAGDYLTIAGKVCILKEAARQWIEANKGE